MSPTDRRTYWKIEDVLDRTDLAALLDEMTEPAGRSGPGRKWHCPMPYHEDHRASVSMFRDRHGHERWRCWSGDHRGDAIDLVVTVTGRDRSEAIDLLAARAGMHPEQPLPPKRSRPAIAPAATEMDPAIARYVHACHRILQTPTGRPIREWLHARGLDEITTRTNLIGCDPGRAMMRRQGGLPRGAGMAATLPAYGPTGQLAYVQARYLDVDHAGRKYDNPSAALAPHPRLAFPVNATVDRTGVLVVCEGLPDALTATQAGFQSVALLGAQTPDEGVAARIANHAINTESRIALVCDPDPAGRRVAALLEPLLAEHGQYALVIEPPDGFDLNDWALHDSAWPERLAPAALEPALIEEPAVVHEHSGPSIGIDH